MDCADAMWRRSPSLVPERASVAPALTSHVHDEHLSLAMEAPAFALLDLLNGYRVTQALYVAARLRIADRLADGPLGSEELARTASADPGALLRLLRALVSFGVFT